MTCRIMQFGTSRFLQAHVDLFVSEALERGEARGSIAVVQSTGSADSRRRIAGFRRLRQFPVLLRGRHAGQIVERQISVGSVTEAWNADEDWSAIGRRFVETIDTIVSNTGDRGWEVTGDQTADDAPPRSFPSILLALLQLRYRAGGSPPVLLPCELVPANGTALRNIVVGLAARAGREPAFIEWLREGCFWANSLVDRIVSEALDPVGAVAEPYALWAIETQPGLLLPCRHADAHLVPDLRPYERLKLFILNLGHTILAEQWLASSARAAHGTVFDAMADPSSREQLDAIYEEDVLPVFARLDMAEQASAYRDTVLERFANPFLRHRLADIATNHAAKKQRRIAPLLALARETGAPVSARLQRILCSPVGTAP